MSRVADMILGYVRRNLPTRALRGGGLTVALLGAFACGRSGLVIPRAQPDAALCDGAPCANPTTPRQIAPLSTSTATSRRPMFHWALPDGTEGAHVQVCRDRACATVITEFDALGSSGAPSTDLPVGVVFWRVRGRAGGVTGDTPSATWQVTIGARTAATNASWGTTPDVNGDGFADVLLGAYDGTDPSRAYVFLGSAAGLGSMPSAVLDSHDGEFAVTGASAGDVNGDGFSDVIFGGANEAYVLLGGARGLDPQPAWVAHAPADSPAAFGRTVSSAGDVNGDGYADVIVGAPGDTGPVGGAAYVYLGGPDGLASTPATTLDPLLGQGGDFGETVASAGDVNGDGFGDVIVATNATGATLDPNGGGAFVFLGSPAGLNPMPVALLRGNGGGVGNEVTAGGCAGDVNGDGLADVIVEAQSLDGAVGSAFVYLGDDVGVATAPTPLAVTDGYTLVAASYGFPIAGDVNGDGFSDVLAGAQRSGEVDRMYVYPGSAFGVGTTAASFLGRPEASATGFYAGASVGDVTGDGVADVMLMSGASSSDQRAGRGFLYPGGAAGLATMPTTTLTGMSGVNEGFGNWVARAGALHGDGARRGCVGGPWWRL